MLQKFQNKTASVLALVLASLIAAPAFATGGGVDVSGVVSAIQATLVPVGLIGGAVLLVIVAIKTYKWVRRAM